MSWPFFACSGFSNRLHICHKTIVWVNNEQSQIYLISIITLFVLYNMCCHINTISEHIVSYQLWFFDMDGICIQETKENNFLLHFVFVWSNRRLRIELTYKSGKCVWTDTLNTTKCSHALEKSYRLLNL